jgi:hypothetical protein
MTTAEVLVEGVWSVLAVESGGTCLAIEYIEGLILKDKKRMLALLQRTADHGPLGNIQKFRQLTRDIFEFKSYQDRVLCFFDGEHRIVLTHGYKKKQDKADPVEIQRAERLRAAYLDSK